jgi:hypothetical protein
VAQSSQPQGRKLHNFKHLQPAAPQHTTFSLWIRTLEGWSRAMEKQTTKRRRAWKNSLTLYALRFFMVCFFKALEFTTVASRSGPGTSGGPPENSLFPAPGQYAGGLRPGAIPALPCAGRAGKSTSLIQPCGSVPARRGCGNRWRRESDPPQDWWGAHPGPRNAGHHTRRHYSTGCCRPPS